MATVDYTSMPTDVIPASAPPREEVAEPTGAQLHRIRTVRLQQGVSMRTAARHTGVDVRRLRLQEQETSDLRLSDLRKWQKALDVPLAELIVEPDDGLSAPIMARARMVRVMKTVAAIRERSKSASIRRMAEMLSEQLIDIMPELAEVSPWHNYGQRRSLDEYGRIMDQTYSDELLCRTQND